MPLLFRRGAIFEDLASVGGGFSPVTTELEDHVIGVSGIGGVQHVEVARSG